MTTTREALDTVAAELLTADHEGDQVALARIAWELLGQAGAAAAKIDRLHAVLYTFASQNPPGAAPKLGAGCRGRVLARRLRAEPLASAEAC